MQMTGSVTRVETVKVDISPRDMIDAMEKRWLSDIKQSGNYINRKGEWEDWTDTGHGSGITEIIREATDDEKAISQAFRTLRRVEFSTK
ncbi:hypothetical protein D3C80_497260 [compost metagenome]